MKIKSYPDSRPGGFTLTELLIVIAIIAVLVSLLLPTLDRVTQEGRSAKCSSNMRQLLTGRKLYGSDHNNMTIPLRPEWPADANGICTWRYYLCKQYNMDPKVFLCPTAPSAAMETGGESWRTNNSDVPSNYAQMGNVPWNLPMASGNIQNYVQQLDLIETRDHWPDLQIANWQTVWGDGFGILGYWHQYRMTCGYQDGHVERKKLGDTVTPVCQWDTNNGLADGKVSHSGDYNAMPSYYK